MPATARVFPAFVPDTGPPLRRVSCFWANPPSRGHRARPDTLPQNAGSDTRSCESLDFPDLSRTRPRQPLRRSGESARFWGFLMDHPINPQLSPENRAPQCSFCAPQPEALSTPRPSFGSARRRTAGAAAAGVARGSGRTSHDDAALSNVLWAARELKLPGEVVQSSFIIAQLRRALGSKNYTAYVPTL